MMMKNKKEKNEIESLQLFDESFLDQISSEAEALELSFFRRTPRQRTVRFLAEIIGMSGGHFTRVISGLAGMPANRAVALIRALGNALWLQYVARELGLAVVPLEKYQAWQSWQVGQVGVSPEHSEMVTVH